MFNKLFNLLSDETGEVGTALGVFLCFYVCSFIVTVMVISVSAQAGEDLTWTSPEIVCFMVGMLPIIITSLVLVGDMLISHFVGIVYEGEKEVKLYLLKKLFGDNGHRTYHWDNESTSTAYLVLSQMIFIPSGILVLMYNVPILGFGLFIIAAIVGMYFGAAFMCQKIVRVNTKLKNHVSDPNAHSNQKENEQ